MSHITKFSFVALLGLALSGCASMAEKSCESGDSKACGKVVKNYVKQDELTDDNQMYLVKICEENPDQGCKALASVCEAYGGMECIQKSFAHACKQGRQSSCSTLRTLIRKSVTDCNSEEACIEAVQVAQKLEETEPSPENRQLFMDSTERLCHNFKRGDVCAMVAQVFVQKGDEQKALEHIAEACKYGHEKSCETMAALQAMTETSEAKDATRLKSKCYEDLAFGECIEFARQIERDDQGEASRALQWACGKGYPQACSYCKERKLGCRKSASAPGPQTPTRKTITKI